MRLNLFLFGLIVLFSNRILSQQLVINEVSQGPSGAKEYVELLVVGTITCNSIPCLDLRNYIIDDNNGNHASGAGTGIASGCVKFQNIPFWSCIPIGTMILIYNDADLNALIPPVDLSMNDGNCRLIIPISNCTLLEKNTSQPSTGTSTYPSTGFSTCGSWGPISMANGDDSFQTINSSGGLEHSVSWGNNTLSPIIYFSAAAGGQVAIMTNSLNNNSFAQANWSQLPVAGNETPGSPNNALNAAWISSMTNNCSALLPLTSTVTSINAGCSCNGSATINVSGAIAPYTYTWLPAGGNGSVATGLCSGVYTVSCTSFNGCIVTKTLNISSSTSLSVSLNTTSVQCFGQSSGSAFANVSGGSLPYTYTWSPSAGNLAAANNLSAGSYTVLVKDNNNCTVTAVVNVAQPTLPLSASISFTNASCGGSNGSSSVSASGGTPGYTYLWSPTGGNNSIASGLGSGNYSVTITDANNCQLTKTISIIQTTSLSFTLATTSVSCFGGNNGAATVTPAGGIAPINYTWSPAPAGGQGTAIATGLIAQTYTIAVGDSSGCTLTNTFLISQPASSITAVLSSTNNTCFGLNNGSIFAGLAGGTPGYTYTWTPTGGNSALATGLAAGSYTLVAKDINGCGLNAFVTITQPASMTAIPSSTNALCFGSNNGVASVVASGGNGNYTYVWSPAGGTSSVAANLSPGTYTVTVKDLNNCTVSTFTTVSQPSSAITVTVNNTNVTCNGFTNGSASVVISGGTPGYTTTWLPIGASSSVITGLAVGNYSVVIIDQNNCLASSSLTIQQPAPITVGINQLTLCAGQSGILTSSVSGGIGPYFYNWNGSPGASTLQVSSSGGLSYSLSVTDNSGCSAPIQVVNVTAFPPLNLMASASKTVCTGSTSSFTAQASGGLGIYQYTWFPGNIQGPGLTATINGPVVFTVIASDGCSLPNPVQTITVSTEAINTPSIITSKFKGCTPLCINFSNSAFTTPSNIQASNWNFGNGDTIIGLQPFYCFNSPGTFSVSNTFTTVGGCVGTVTLNSQILVFESPNAGFNSTTEVVNYLESTVNFINQSSGASSYYWDFGGAGSSTSENPVYNFEAPGKYFVTLIASNGNCSDTAFKVIECLPEFSFYAPNAFSPNSDKLNEVFIPKGLGWDTKYYTLMIFDRWGERIFSTNDYTQGWDGTYKGVAVAQDSYIWKVKLKDVFGQFHHYTGHVVIIK